MVYWEYLIYNSCLDEQKVWYSNNNSYKLVKIEFDSGFIFRSKHYFYYFFHLFVCLFIHSFAYNYPSPSSSLV